MTIPAGIAPEATDSENFSGWNCSQLAKEQAGLGEHISIASDDLRTSHRSTAIFDILADSVLFGDPYSGVISGIMLTPTDKKKVKEIAQLKGQLEAVQSAMMQKDCSEPLLEMEKLVQRKSVREEAEEAESFIK